WEAVIGLEIHAQIQAKSKLFSSSKTSFGIPINSAVSFLDASLPGCLPVLNKQCIVAAIKASHALNCSINEVSYFDRKHYFYADLPSGYQITQHKKPVAIGGSLKYLAVDSNFKKVTEKEARLIQIQLEQDSGKSLHDKSKSLIDLNRAGIGLLEIVTQPDFRSAADVVGFVKELQLLLQTIDVCDGKMEEGSLRVDVSVSIRRFGSFCLGTRTEIKNLNSIRSLGRAVSYEISRQIEIKESGYEVQNETRYFHAENDITVPLRDKEGIHDYRFMPEPNLPPLILNTKGKNGTNIEDVLKDFPILPSEQRKKLVDLDHLSLAQSDVLVSHPFLFDIYTECSSNLTMKHHKMEIANFLINEVLYTVNK
ncbi:hypothetical protein HELRODRAFT_119237, partial [Helobdella robusta]|uniref:Aspartyl/Glutamyl-tRNA(Gln) amidotransferase subunit B/E catalytic domain-containing protein n=1 Tax=Helobdella robusta TaxID=6412 RepID=T1EGM7_HELRO